MHRNLFRPSITRIVFFFVLVALPKQSFAQANSSPKKNDNKFSLIHYCNPGKRQILEDNTPNFSSNPCLKEAFFNRLSKEPLNAFINFDDLGFEDDLAWSSPIKMCFIGSTTSACNILKRLGSNSQKFYDKGGHEMTWVLACKRIENAEILLDLKSRHDWVTKEKTGSFILSICEDEVQEPIKK